MPPKANSGVIKLRNAMSHVLYEHKQSMPDEVYKKLYETLGNETRQTLNKRWVKLHYIKAIGSTNFDSEMDETVDYYPVDTSQHYHTRNILLTTDAIDRISDKLQKTYHSTFHAIIPEDCNDRRAIQSEIEKEMDEENMFSPFSDVSYMIIKMTIFE